MELTDTERQLLQLLQDKEEQAQRESQQRTMRFLAGVSERTGIPVDVLGINAQTGMIMDARGQAHEDAGYDGEDESFDPSWDSQPVESAD